MQLDIAVNQRIFQVFVVNSEDLKRIQVPNEILNHKWYGSGQLH